MVAIRAVRPAGSPLELLHELAAAEPRGQCRDALGAGLRRRALLLGVVVRRGRTVKRRRESRANSDTMWV